MTSLDFTSLRDAIKQLTDGYARAEELPYEEIVRDGAIQRYEYTYELSIKFLRRALETLFGESGVDQMDFREMLRTAAERGLIRDPVLWFGFREDRNKSAHTYDANIAALVFASGKRFLPEAAFLLQSLDEHNHSA